MITQVDYAIVGAGIAGQSIASRLVGRGRKVLLLEMEESSPYHSTARSAALKDPIYVPNFDVAALTMFADTLFKGVPDALRPKGALHLFREQDLGAYNETLIRCRAVGAKVEELDRAEIARRFPFLVTADCYAALYAPPGAASTIDVDILYQHFRRRFSEGGGKPLHNEQLKRARFQGGAWTIETETQTIRATNIINCAGAWADIVAARAGLTPLDLQPLLRTVAETSLQDSDLIPQPEGPFVFWDVQDDLYADFKRGGRVLISLADEQASQPCDAYAKEEDVGEALFNFENRTHLRVVMKQPVTWAGLRTFAGDRKPVIGWSGEHPNFFWSAAYGGFGIESSLAASAIAADLILGTSTFTAQVKDHEIRVESFSPARLELARVAR